MNLESETRKGYYISAEMKKIWAVEMELLNKLLEVCKKYNLRIYAEGGTLLGAVREHGYIPWDDDIDMAMPREDYDKLREIAATEFKTPYFFQCGYTDIYPRGQTKIRKDGTAEIFKHDIFKDYHHGIFIDILPLDSLPDNEDEYNKLIESRLNVFNKMKLFTDHHFALTDWKYNWNFIKSYIEIKKVGFNNYFKTYDDIVKQYKDADCQFISILSWSDKKKYIRKKSWYRSTIYLPFEDIQIPVPIDYDMILTKQYGDYMKPVEEPTVHGKPLVFDPDHSYLDYLPSLRKEYKWDRCKNRWSYIKGMILSHI